MSNSCAQCVHMTTLTSPYLETELSALVHAFWPMLFIGLINILLDMIVGMN